MSLSIFWNLCILHFNSVTVYLLKYNFEVFVLI